MEQRTDEWHAARKGKMTCSRMAEAIGYIGSRRRLWRELTGRERHDAFAPTARMVDGVTYEPMAIAVYEEQRNSLVERVGFVMHPTLDWIGGSPDGLTFFGGIEAKCPAVFYEGVPDYYMPQMQGLMEITERAHWDFVVWTPETWSITRVWRNRDYWRELYELLCEFWAYVEADTEPPAFKRGKKPRINAPVETLVLHKE